MLDAGLSGARSVCRASPVSSIAGPSPENSSSARRWTDSSEKRAKRKSPAGPSLAAIRAAARTGGKGVMSASRSGPPMRSQVP